MIHLNINYRLSNNYYPAIQTKNVNFNEQTSYDTKNREVTTTWKYDEEGNIVYYTYDIKTGEIISKTIYKNPYRNLIQQTGKL